MRKLSAVSQRDAGLDVPLAERFPSHRSGSSFIEAAWSRSSRGFVVFGAMPILFS